MCIFAGFVFVGAVFAAAPTPEAPLPDELTELRATSPIAAVVQFEGDGDSRVYLDGVGPPMGVDEVFSRRLSVVSSVWGEVESGQFWLFQWEESVPALPSRAIGDRFLIFAHPWELTRLTGHANQHVEEPWIFAADAVGVLSSRHVLVVTSDEQLLDVEGNEVCVVNNDEGAFIRPCADGTRSNLALFLEALRLVPGAAVSLPGFSG